MKKKLKLPDVTLLSATSSEVDAAQVSMRISLHNIEFGASKLLSSSSPKKTYSTAIMSFNLSFGHTSGDCTGKKNWPLNPGIGVANFSNTFVPLSPILIKKSQAAWAKLEQEKNIKKENIIFFIKIYYKCFFIKISLIFKDDLIIYLGKTTVLSSELIILSLPALIPQPKTR